MTCNEVKKYLSLFLDSELGPETTFEISRHVEECYSCRKRLQQEERLESQIRALLQRVHPDDEKVWKTAVQKIKGQNLIHFSARGYRTKALALTLVTIIVAAFVVWNLWPHRELDLAEAVAAAHVEYLENPRYRFDVGSDNGELEAFFQKNLSPSFQWHKGENLTLSVTGASLCDINGVQSAHFVLSDDEVPVSVFWIRDRDLVKFPMTYDRMARDGPSFECRVQSYVFHVRQIQDAVVCAIGEVEAAELRSLVNTLYLSL